MIPLLFKIDQKNRGVFGFLLSFLSGFRVCASLRCPCQEVDATGFEPAASASRTQRSTKLSHASICHGKAVLTFPNRPFIILFLSDVVNLYFVKSCARGFLPHTWFTFGICFKSCAKKHAQKSASSDPAPQKIIVPRRLPVRRKAAHRSAVLR